MRAIRIYEPGHYQCGQTITLSDGASRHIALVLRMEPGEGITLFCGDNQEFDATIDKILKKKVIVRIQSQRLISRESPCVIQLGQAISKGERMEIVVQKAVELGVTSITPLITRRCAVRLDAEKLAKKQLQWQAIAIASCEQCGRNKIPIIHQPSPIEQFIQQTQASCRLILDPGANASWPNWSMVKQDVALLIGPEGGFTEEEITQAQESGYQSWHLGPRILRTETAAIAAITVLQAIKGDLGSDCNGYCCN